MDCSLRYCVVVHIARTWANAAGFANWRRLCRAGRAALIEAASIVGEVCERRVAGRVIGSGGGGVGGEGWWCMWWMSRGVDGSNQSSKEMRRFDLHERELCSRSGPVPSRETEERQSAEFDGT